jgi:hypothetical protein
MVRTARPSSLEGNISNSESTPAQNYVWRQQVSQWSYDVIDHLGAPRETVFVAMNILDRYIAKTSSEELMTNKMKYERAAITSFFLATRTSTPLDLKIPNLLCLSRSALQPRDILKEGRKILETISFENRILTPQRFVKTFLGLLPPTVNCLVITTWLELSIYLIEISVCDGNFSRVPPSQLAFGSILVAMKKCQEFRVDRKTFDIFAKAMLEVNGIDMCSTGLRSVCVRLQNIYSQSQESALTTSPNVIEDEEDTPAVSTPSVQTSRPISPVPESC